MKERFYWTDEKVEELKSLWGTMPLYKLASHFHTIPETINEKAIELGLGNYKSNRWTKEEEQLLIEYSKKYVTKTIAKKLNRSYLAVQKKAIKLGIELHSEVDPWKKWMVDYLKDNINQKPIGEIESVLGLSYHRILTKCKELGIEYRKESWTEDEISTLREYAKKCHYTELVKVLPNRSVGAITAKAYELGIETISDYHKLDEEIAIYIRENWGTITAAEIARNLKISIGIVYRYKKEFGLPDVGQQKKWTDEKIEKLRKDAKTKTRSELAKKYKTSVGQISSISRKNGITLIDSKKIWNDELDKQLLELVKQDLSISEIARQMEIKANNIRVHLKDLGIDKYVSTKQQAKRWTEEEISILRQMSLTSTISEIANKLGKTENQVSSKARKLGIQVDKGKNHLWTEEETKILINLSSSYDRHMIAKIMNRTESVIKDKAEELGLNLKVRDRQNWTSEDEIKLEEYAKEFTIKEIANLLDRSLASVSGKLKSMGLQARMDSRFWSEEENKKLKELSKEHSIEEISFIMKKSYEAIVSKMYQMGIRAVNKSNRPWTSEEEQELQELLTTYSSFEVAEILKRSEESIIVRAIKLGYEIDAKHRRWTKDEETFLSDLWGNDSIDNISKKLNRTPSSVMNRVFKLGLGSQIENNYDGLRVQEIADLFGVNRNTILTSWVALGLKLNFRKRSIHSAYAYVQINNLYEFLESNQNIWDSRNLEKNILGIEPDWLKEKRKQDLEKPPSGFTLGNLTKQQLLQVKNYFLELQEQENEKQKKIDDSNVPRLIKSKNDRK